MAGFVADLFQHNVFIGVISKIPYAVCRCHGIEGRIIGCYISAGPVLNIEVIAVRLDICQLIPGQFHGRNLRFTYMIDACRVDLVMGIIRITLEIILILCGFL